MKRKVALLFACTLTLISPMSYGQSSPIETEWSKQKVVGRDEVLRGIESRAKANGDQQVQDVRGVIDSYEVDMYRLVLQVGKHYGMDQAYAIMSETVSAMRLRWLDQRFADLTLSGTPVQKGLILYKSYFQPHEGDFLMLEQAPNKLVFKRRDYVNAISYACAELGLDPILVNNKVYAPTMTQMMARIDPGLKYSFLKYDGDGWYEETIEFSPK